MERFESGLAAAIERHQTQSTDPLERSEPSGAHLVEVDSLYDRLVVPRDSGRRTLDAVREEYPQRHNSHAIEASRDPLRWKPIACAAGTLVVLGSLWAWQRRRT